MSWLVRAYVGLRESSHQPHISYEVEQLVSSALVREMEFDVAEVALVRN